MNARELPGPHLRQRRPRATLATLRAPLKLARPDGGFGTPFDHMALEGDIDGSPWPADVGFGDGFLYPIPVVENAEGDYWLTRDGDDWFLAEGSTTKDRSTPTPRRLDDFADACRYALEERFDFVLEEV